MEGISRRTQVLRHRRIKICRGQESSSTPQVPADPHPQQMDDEICELEGQGLGREPSRDSVPHVCSHDGVVFGDRVERSL